MKKFGFTLAEVLVTLSIIGVVAALTLPQLTTNNTNKILEVQIKKFYNTLVTGTDKYLAENDAESLTDISDYTAIKFVEAVFRNPTKGSASSFASSYRTTGGTSYSKTNLHTTKVYKLDDGTVFGIEKNNNDLLISVDVNGTKGPNVIGRDLWQLKISPDGSIGDGHPVNN